MKIMEELKKQNGAELNEKEIVFSQSVKAGKRIYYIDVKKSRKDDMFLAITESKKIVTNEGDEAQVNFEKHKIFLYKEDFEKFTNSLQKAIQFIESVQGSYNRPAPEKDKGANENDTIGFGEEIKLDIEF